METDTENILSSTILEKKGGGSRGGRETQNPAKKLLYDKDCNKGSEKRSKKKR